jgi:hypothetical protein
MKRKATTNVPVFQQMLSSWQLWMPPSPFRPRLFKFNDVLRRRAEVHLWVG